MIVSRTTVREPKGYEDELGMASGKPLRSGKRSVRTLFLSDIHLGFPHARARELNEFLQGVEAGGNGGRLGIVAGDAGRVERVAAPAQVVVRDPRAPEAAPASAPAVVALTTVGDWSSGIVAQSIGGGGGKAGSAAATGTGGRPDITLNGNSAVGGTGGSGGQGGTVTVGLGGSTINTTAKTTTTFTTKTATRLPRYIGEPSMRTTRTRGIQHSAGQPTHMNN